MQLHQRGGHYYNGRGTVQNNWGGAKIWARADIGANINKVIAKGTVDNALAQIDTGYYWAEINCSGHPGKTNRAITGATDSKGSKETVHAQK